MCLLGKSNHDLLESEDDKNLLPSMDDLFPEMRPRLSTDGKSEVIPEATVVSSVHTGVTTGPVVDKQEEIL